MYAVSAAAIIVFYLYFQASTMQLQNIVLSALVILPSVVTSRQDSNKISCQNENGKNVDWCEMLHIFFFISCTTFILCPFFIGSSCTRFLVCRGTTTWTATLPSSRKGYMTSPTRATRSLELLHLCMTRKMYDCCSFINISALCFCKMYIREVLFRMTCFMLPTTTRNRTGLTNLRLTVSFTVTRKAFFCRTANRVCGCCIAFPNSPPHPQNTITPALA